MEIRYTNLPDNKNKPFGGAYSVHDRELTSYRDETIRMFTINNNYSVKNAEIIKQDFLQTYKQWMFSHFPRVKGIEQYNHMCFTQGTTESFAQFYIRYRNNKRLRIARGEYFYHQMMKALWYDDNFAWLEDEPIKEGDVVLLSVPFSDTGAVPNDLEKILCDCDRLKVPVMIDLAYLNISVDLQFNLDHSCIEYVVSSLSKVFPIETHRIGIRMQKEPFEDQIYVINEHNYNYINLLSAYLGTAMMKKFPANYVFDKYHSKQLAFCQKLDLVPSYCVYFGLDYTGRFKEYNRGNNSNRLCFSRIWDGRQKYDL
jgi:Cys-tRNA synthase (O-phospho-L-seryl-tRNA:Cys-tRNA synthase)